MLHIDVMIVYKWITYFCFNRYYQHKDAIYRSSHGRLVNWLILMMRGWKERQSQDSPSIGV